MNFVKCFLLVISLQFSNFVNAQNINTIIGGLGDGGSATAAILTNPANMTVDKNGNIYIADLGNKIIRKVDVHGVISIYAGVPRTGGSGVSGNNIPAIFATFAYPTGLAIDTSGNLFITDRDNTKIRKINTPGIISDYVDDGGRPLGIAIDKDNNIYIANSWHHNVVRYSTSGTTVIAGTGTGGFNGDGIAATAARLSNPTGVCVDKLGNIFIADNGNNRVRKINTSGVISTVAGNGIIGHIGDGGPATTANFNTVYAVAVDSSGNLFIADNNNSVIRKVNTSGIVTTIAGTYFSVGYSGDGGSATAAKLYTPAGLATDLNGNLFIADNGNHRIRKVNNAGVITTVAGSNEYSSQGYKGDGGPIVSALLNNPNDLTYDTSGNLYIADKNNHCVRKVTSTGIITTVAGTGISGFSGDMGSATAAKLSQPSSVATDRKGNIFVCDGGNRRIRKIDGAGIISTYAGNGTGSYSGDGHRADSAGFVSVDAIATDGIGNLYISDSLGYRIRKVDTNQVITTFAGTGVAGYFGDGGVATAARLTTNDICSDRSGNLYIADGDNYRVRKIDLSGNITTIAGSGATGIFGIGGMAILAGFGKPTAVATDKDDNIYISSNNQIYKVGTSGIISVYGGTGTGGFSGDGGPALSATMNNTNGLILDTSGNLLFTQNSSNRVREIYNARLSISTPRTTVCTTSVATFTASVSAAPIYSVHYHWQKNGINVGADSTQYTSFGFINGDKIVCYITDGISSAQIARSNEITMNAVSPTGLPSVGFHSSPYTVSTFCGGTIATCTPVYVTLGGDSPVFDWYVNGVYAYTGGSFSFTPVNYDTVTLKMTSSISCLVVNTDSFYDYYNHIIPPGYPTLTIQRSGSSGSTTVCTGTTVTCSIGSATYNAASPVYNWYKNDTLVYTGISYNFTPVNSDVIKCKMITTDPCALVDTAMSNSLVFVVTPKVYPTITISPDLDTIICGDKYVNCSSTTSNGGTSINFTWYKNDTVVNTYSDKYTFTPRNGDKIYCRFRSNAGCLLNDTAYSNLLNFTVITPIADSVKIVVAPSDKVCSGKTVTFSATPYNGGTTPTYEWYQGSTIIPGVIGPIFSLPVTSNSQIYCKMYSSICASPDPAVSNSIYVSTILPPEPRVTVSFSPTAKVCPGVAVTAFATGINEGNAPVYKWYMNSGDVFTGTSYQFIPTEGDQLYCQLTSNAECVVDSEVISSITTFNMDTLPSVTVNCTPGNVNFNGTEVTLSAVLSATSSTIQLQWIKNGIPIAGATDYTYTSKNFSIWDSVYCRLTASGTCIGTVNSNVQVIQAYHSMRLYPNPNNGHFVINGNNYDANGEPVNIRIFNATGKLVYEKNTKFDAISFYADIDLGRSLSPGVYTLRMKYKYENASFFFVIK